MTALWIAMLLTAFWGAGVFPATLNETGAPMRMAREVETTSPPQETKITKSNWEQDPRIIAIREIVTATNSALKSGVYKIDERQYEFCEGDQFLTVLRIARDSKGAVGWFEDYSEGEDATWQLQYYYDPAGRLRFVYGMARGFDGTREQLRIYFDEERKRVWQTDLLLKGPGCPWCFGAYTDSDEALVFDPAKKLADDKGCKELRPKPKPRT